MGRHDVDGVRAKVLRHYRVMAQTEPQYAATRIAALAPGVVAVEDRSGECDVLFDVSRWEFVHQGLWGGGESRSPSLRRLGLNSLPSMGFQPHEGTIASMAANARRHLKPKCDVAWFDAPDVLDLAAAQ